MEAEITFAPTSNFTPEREAASLIFLPEESEADETTPFTFNLIAEGAD
jgi:hypothetical protein